MTLRNILLVLALTQAGCYVHVPVPIGSLPPGSEVRLELTRSVLSGLPELGRTMGRTVSGVLQAQDDRETVLAVEVDQFAQGTVLRTIRQDVSIATDQILFMDYRKHSGTRTALSIVGASAVVAGLWVAFRGIRSEPELPDDPPPQEIRVPALFSIPIGK